jgi:hypothetical protein
MTWVSDPPRRSRRQLLAGSLGVAASGVVTLAAGCASAPAPPPPDPLQPVLTAALADAAFAEAVAATHPRLRAVAGALAADRRVHAEALGAEVRRAAAAPASSTAATATPAPAPPPDPAAASAALVAATRAAQAQAAALVTGLPRFRAGLAAAVAACCASHLVVLG